MEQLEKFPFNKEIHIKLDSGKLYIQGEDRQDIEASGNFRNMAFKSLQEDEKLILSYSYKANWFQWIYAWIGYSLKKGWPTGNILLKVPQKCDLKANVYSGSLSVEGTNGSANLQVGSGKAIVSQCIGKLKMLLSGAECIVKDFCGSVSIYSYTGDIDFLGVLSTDSPNKIESLTGTIKATLTDPDLKFNAAASTGQITLESEDGTKQDARTRAYGTLGNGTGFLQLVTKIGNIAIKTISTKKHQL